MPRTEIQEGRIIITYGQGWPSACELIMPGEYVADSNDDDGDDNDE